MKKHVAYLLAAIALVLAPLTAHAGKKEDAKKHLAKAMTLHKEGKFDDALVELQAAYSLDPQPDFMYAIAQLNAKLGRCDQAKTFYRSYLATQKDPQIKKVVDQAIDACKEATPPVPDNPPPPPPPDKTAPPPPPDKPVVTPQDKTTTPFKPDKPERSDDPLERKPVPVARKHWYSDKLGIVMVVGGIGASAAGFVLYTGAKSDLDAAEDRSKTSTLESYNSLVDSAHHKRTVAVVVGGAGAALVIGGVMHMMLRDTRVETSRVSVQPTEGGGVVTLQGGF